MRPFQPARLALALAFVAALAGCASAPSDSADALPTATGATPSSAVGATPGTRPASATPTPGETIVPPPATSAPAGSDGRVSSAATAPLVVALQAEDARAFFGAGTRVTLTVTGSAYDDVRAGIALPLGVEVVDGNLSYRGAFDGGPLTLAATLRAGAPGSHALRGWAEAAMPVGSRVAPAILLEVEGDAAQAAFSAGALLRPDIRVTLTPQGSTAADVAVTSPAATSARLVADAPAAFAAAGALDETVALAPGATVARRIELGPAARWEGGGYQTLAVYVYADPAVEGRLHAGMLHYWWEGDALRVSSTPPEGLGAAGTGGGPSTGGDGGTAPQPASPA